MFLSSPPVRRRRIRRSTRIYERKSKSTKALEPYSIVVDKPVKITYQFKTIYLWILYGIVIVGMIGLVLKNTTLTSVGGVCIVIYFLIGSLQYRRLRTIIKQAAIDGSVKMIGSKWSFFKSHLITSTKTEVKLGDRKRASYCSSCVNRLPGGLARVALSENAVEISDMPQMQPATINILKDLLRGATTYLEFGAGGSTVMAWRLGVPTIVSVDSDQRYLSAIKVKLDSMESVSRLLPVFVDIGPTGEWGRPTSTKCVILWQNYWMDAWKILKEFAMEPDVVLIDGRFRVACCLHTLLSAQPGTKILLDDYNQRECYRVIEQFAGAPKMHGRAALFVVANDLDFHAIQLALTRYAVYTC